MTGLDTVSAVSDYSASKHAFVSMSEAMRDELSGDGIVVSLLCPGAIRTGLGRKRLPPQGNGAAAKVSPATAEAVPANAMSASVVAAIAIDGLTRGDFYIFTHAEGRNRLQRCVDEIMLGFDRLDAIIAER